MGASIWITEPLAPGHAYTYAEVNVTYNLTPMLVEAGFGRWRDHVDDTVPEFGSALMRLRDTLAADPDRFRALNPDNGWGDYDGLLEAVRECIDRVPWERPGLEVGFSL